MNSTIAPFPIGKICSSSQLILIPVGRLPANVFEYGPKLNFDDAFRGQAINRDHREQFGSILA